MWLTTEEKDEVALAEHLKLVHKLDSVELFNLSVELFNLSYTFTVMQLEPRNIDKCEQKWISQLVTLEPYGLNTGETMWGGCCCCFCDSILTMSKKATSNSQSQRG